MQTDKYVYIFFEKMLLGATSGEHFGSTFSVIYILLMSYIWLNYGENYFNLVYKMTNKMNEFNLYT